MNVRPISVRHAIAFVASTHRRLPRIQGGMWAIGVYSDSCMIGVAIVGHPARLMMHDTLSVLRVAVIEGNPNACSMLYGACARAARAMGAQNLVTYTHADEHGASLKASGWIKDGSTDGGEWGRASRSRPKALDPAPKNRWFAPWSERLVCIKQYHGKASSRG